MKCIIYGLSVFRKQIESYLKDTIDIIGYSDSFSELDCFEGKKLYKPNELVNLDFDVIIIAIRSFADCFDIEENLINLGIENKKIIPLYKFMKYISMVKQNKNLIDTYLNKSSKVDGLIFGISYGEYGINPKYLKHEFYNFCRSSQDLYYTLIQLKYIKQMYKDKIENLKYIILDMYDYTYFNFDTSLSKVGLNFIYDNEFYEFTHNLNKNKNYSKKHIEKIKIKLEDDEILLLNSIIKSKHIIRGHNGYYLNPETNNIIIDEEDIDRYLSINSNECSNFEKKLHISTEEENIKIIEEVINEILDINSEIKIYLILIPRYKIKEDRRKYIEFMWKNRFYNTLERLKLRYKFDFLDFTDYEEISNRREYYLDLEHLNYNGAIEFTKLLSNKIE